MKLARVMRYITFMLITVLALGPAMALAAPMMNAEQGTASTMAMGGDHAQPAQHSGCSGCTDTGTSKAGMAKAAVAAYCNVGCLAPALLPSATLAMERTTVRKWHPAPRAEHSGVTVGIDPYPPNFSS